MAVLCQVLAIYWCREAVHLAHMCQVSTESNIRLPVNVVHIRIKGFQLVSDDPAVHMYYFSWFKRNSKCNGFSSNLKCVVYILFAFVLLHIPNKAQVYKINMFNKLYKCKMNAKIQPSRFHTKKARIT